MMTWISDAVIILTGQRYKAASVEGDILVHHRAHTVDDGRVHYGDWSVQVPVDFGAGTGEVKDGIAGRLVDGDREADR